MPGEEDLAKAAERPDDMIAAILEDHAEIKQLFAAVESAGDAEQKRDAFEALVRKLAVHETAEEEIVHPLTRRAEGAESIVEERLHEEAQGKEVLSELERMDVTSAEFDDKFATLKKEVLEHAEREEQMEHPKLEQATSAERLVQLASAFRAAEASAPTHPHPHGPESAIGNIVLGPAVAVMDRARDAVRDAMRKIGA